MLNEQTTTQSNETSPSASAYKLNECTVAQHLVNTHYHQLLNMARQKRRRSGLSDTMQTSDILHESYLKLSGRTVWQSPDHFLRTAALAMRQVIVDHARKKCAAKRGDGQNPLSLDEAEAFLPEYTESPEDIVKIANLLDQMEGENPRYIQVVDARYFSGMSETETAQALNVSERTVRRDWQQARAWLSEQLLAV